MTDPFKPEFFKAKDADIIVVSYFAVNLGCKRPPTSTLLAQASACVLRSMDEIGDNAASVAATVAATNAASMQRIEIVGERRRAYDAAFRARVVAECMVPGTRVQELALRHGICSSLIY